MACEERRENSALACWVSSNDNDAINYRDEIQLVSAISGESFNVEH